MLLLLPLMSSAVLRVGVVVVLSALALPVVSAEVAAAVAILLQGWNVSGGRTFQYGSVTLL